MLYRLLFWDGPLSASESIECKTSDPKDIGTYMEENANREHYLIFKRPDPGTWECTDSDCYGSEEEYYASLFT